jgi:HD superfamily phosphohydrolase
MHSLLGLAYKRVHQYQSEAYAQLMLSRLRKLKQLGACCYVYPNAVHTRFEHSLGVSHLSGIFIKTIKKKHPELQISEDDIRRIKTKTSRCR